MTYQSITMIIPPEMIDRDERYDDVIEYVAACTGFNCTSDDLRSGDRVSCDAYFEDDKGNMWHGQLCDPPFPDGSQKYIVDLERKAGSAQPGPK